MSFAARANSGTADDESTPRMATVAVFSARRLMVRSRSRVVLARPYCLGVKVPIAGLLGTTDVTTRSGEKLFPAKGSRRNRPGMAAEVVEAGRCSTRLVLDSLPPLYYRKMVRDLGAITWLPIAIDGRSRLEGGKTDLRCRTQIVR